MATLLALPAICHACGDMAFPTKIMVSPGATVSVNKLRRGGKCPKCGGDGELQIGDYVGEDFCFRVTTFSEAGRKAIEGLQAYFDRIKQGESAAKVLEEAAAEQPAFFKDWRELLKSPQLVATYVALMFVALTYLRGCSTPQPPPPVELAIPKEIVDLLRTLSEKLPDTHHEIPGSESPEQRP